MRRRPPTAVAWIVVAVVLTSCGIGGEATPTRLDEVVLPQESIPDEAPEEGGGPTTVVFFVRGDVVEPVERSLPTTLTSAVTGLLDGPRETETSGGLRSAIPTGTSLRGASLDGEVATIDLSDGFTAVVGPEQVLAIAQIVYTATSIPEVLEVRLAIEGHPIDAARGDGSLAPGTVSRADYPGLFAG